ncbi:MAG: ATP-dependent Clp protease ATP-binding subunit [Bacilli bacterium]|nr:ATP-dependent Clp protease ATP-binding subunit [Bacilli bacterium]
MFSKFSEESQKILLNAKKEMSSLKHPYVGSEHLLLAILSSKEIDVTIKLNDYNINYHNFKEEVLKVIGKGTIANQWFLYTPLLKRIIEGATIECKENKDKEVTPTHLFLSLLAEGDGVAIRILMGMNIDIDALYDEFSNSLVAKKSKNKRKLMIEEYSVDLNKRCLNNELDPVVGRELEIDNVIEILSRRTKNNPLLVGEAGVGKTAIVEELTNRIVSDRVPHNLRNKRILSVAMSSLVAGTKYRGEFEERINKLLKEVEENDDIILFIDEIHTLVGAGGAEGAIDASNILKPALARGKIKVIGATTIEEYSKYLEKDKALDRRFQKIYISEPDVGKTKGILLKLKPLYESFHNTLISDEIVDYIIDVSDKYIYNRKFPDKAIDILDEVCARTVLMKNNNEEKIDKLKQQLKLVVKNKKESIVKEDFDQATEYKNEQNKLETRINHLYLKNNQNNNPKNITKKMVMDVVTAKTTIPIFEDGNTNKKIISLENHLRKKVKGQNQAIEILCNFAKKKQLGFMDNRVHSFLFVGKTGIGKTLLVKEYAKELYNKDNLIRVDMSEYKESHSVSKIIGSPPGYVGYEDQNYLLEKVRNNPYSVILLDEIEKASTDVIKLFLQILDEGKIKDSKGTDVYFHNTTIFMTSNLGCSGNTIGFSEKRENMIMNTLNDYFGVEFVNRIDDIIVFRNLEEEVVKEIIRDKLKKLKVYYQRKNIKLTFNPQLVNKIMKESKYETYGARRIDKVIDRNINNYIINEVLNGKQNIIVKEAL